MPSSMVPRFMVLSSNGSINDDSLLSPASLKLSSSLEREGPRAPGAGGSPQQQAARAMDTERSDCEGRRS